MLKKMAACLSIAALALVSAPLVTAQPSLDEEAMKRKAAYDPVDRSGPLFRTLPEPIRTPRADLKNVPTGITYDDGVVTAAPTTSSFMYGNQFNSASGMAVKSWSITMLTFFIVTGAGTDNVFVSLYGPVAGTTAPFVEDISVTLNNGSGAVNTATIGPYVGTGSFLAGVWYVAGDTVGLGSGTVNGQGHHGAIINDIVGTGFATLPGLNALVSAATANVIPVELMNFSVSSN